MKEYRTFEFRADKKEDETKKLSGHAAVFNSLTDLGYFKEQIKPGAFANAIANDDIRALFNHDANYVLGRNKAGTLKLSEDKQGLFFEIDPPDTQIARDLMVSVDRGDISQCSFGFKVIKEEWDESDNDNPVRTIVEAKLFDISPVTFPAYQETDVNVRSAQDIYESRQVDTQESNKPDEIARLQEQLLRNKLELYLRM